MRLPILGRARTILAPAPLPAFEVTLPSGVRVLRDNVAAGAACLVREDE